MNTPNLREILADVNGTTFISIDTESEVKVRKTIDTANGRIPNPQFGHITKRQVGSNVMVFTNKNSNGYANMVAKRLTKEGKDPQSFELGERTWGTRLPNLPVVEHNGEYYLEVIYLNSGKVQYFQDGQPINVEDIVGMPNQSAPTQGGLDNSVIIRTFKMSSLKAITINKNTYRKFVFNV